MCVQKKRGMVGLWADLLCPGALCTEFSASVWLETNTRSATEGAGMSHMVPHQQSGSTNTGTCVGLRRGRSPCNAGAGVEVCGPYA